MMRSCRLRLGHLGELAGQGCGRGCLPERRVDGEGAEPSFGGGVHGRGWQTVAGSDGGGVLQHGVDDEKVRH
jgi:hypothetical protein